MLERFHITLRNNKVALIQVHDYYAISAIYFFYTVIFQYSN